jgi:CRP-like cAMP-binding protein
MSEIAKLQNDNIILAALAAPEHKNFFANIELIPLPQKKILYKIDDIISYVYFPTAGMISLVSFTEEGGTIEVGMVGYQGMLGVEVFYRTNVTRYETTVQVTGAGYRMPAEIFRQECQHNSALQNILLRYTHLMMVQLTQAAVCHRFHTLEEKLARWLLLTQDLVRADNFSLTQEFLSQMLGVRHTGVSVAASTLQKAGLISYKRGNITILDRSGMEAAACECYEVIQRYNLKAAAR